MWISSIILWLPSDHRAIYLDISTNLPNQLNYANYQRRLLVSTQEHIRKRYIASVQRQFRNLNIKKQILELLPLFHQNKLRQFQKDLDRIDRLITNILLSVEKIANPHRNKPYSPFSPSILK